jgi:hypothetical protein
MRTSTKLIIIFLLGFLVFYMWRWRSRLSFKLSDNDIYIGRHINNTSNIPKIIHQTYKRKDKIPAKVSENFKKFAPEYNRIVYDDNDIEIFLKENFKPCVLNSFRRLKLGAHKADLFRYAVLFVHGGVYMDIKTELVEQLSFPDNQITTVKSIVPSQIYQGVIASPPGQLIFLTLISAITRSGAEPPYGLFIREFMRFIEKDAGLWYRGAKEGLIIGKLHTYNLFQEVCTLNSEDCEDGLDRYGKCCRITQNGRRIIKSRYADFGRDW